MDVEIYLSTDNVGGYSLRIGNTDTFVQNSAGLNGAALNVWDFAFATTQIYLATEGGVFVGDGLGSWQSFDPSPPGVAFYSLELVGNTLYLCKSVTHRAGRVTDSQRAVLPQK